MASIVRRPDDLDAGRAAVAAKELVATASGYLTADVAMQLPFEALGPFKTLLKQFFSVLAWSESDADALSDLVAAHVDTGWWEHDLGSGLTLAHGIQDGRYHLWVAGGGTPAPSIFDRIFDGAVIPEPTPHPRKVKFATGGDPAPGVWYRRTDPGRPDDARVRRLFGEQEVTDVMVAGDFVTIGIGPGASWEHRLEPLLALVTELFAVDGADTIAPPPRTRDELLHEAGRLHPAATLEQLHLLDPDDTAGRAALLGALASDDQRMRRVAVAVLAESEDPVLRRSSVDAGRADASLTVRRTAIDAAADTADEGFRDLFEGALADPDPWTRWKAIRALTELGVRSSRARIEAVLEDDDFQVRFEAAAALRTTDEPT